MQSKSCLLYTSASYGTKFAADNWMHKSMGIQLGLSDSARCQLPEGTDGTGYWTITIRALGYADTVVKFQTTAENLAKHELASDADRAALQAVVTEAQSKAKAAYTADSYANLETELAESVELLSRETLYKAAALEQVTHLTDCLLYTSRSRFSQLLPSLTHSGRKSYRHFSRQKRPRFVSLPQTAR